MPKKRPTTGSKSEPDEAKPPRDPALAAVGDLIRKRRGGEAVFSLAVRSGVPPQSIYKVENGEGGHMKTVLKLARALGIKSLPVTSSDPVNT